MCITEENMFEITANGIAREIMELTDSLESSEELDHAWSKITEALSYLSAKDTMAKVKKSLSEEEVD